MMTLLAFGAGLSFLLAISRAIRRTPESYAAAALFFCASIVLLHLYLELTARLSEFPHFVYWNVPALFCTGPLTHFYLLMFMRSPGERKPGWIHFLPAIVSFFILIPFFIQSGETKTAFVTVPGFDASNPYQFIGMALISLGVLANLFYLLFLFARIFRLRSVPGNWDRSALSPFLIVLGATTVAILAMTLAQFFFKEIMHVAAASLGALIVILFLFGETSVRDDFVREIKRAKYAQSRIAGLDVNAVLARLDQIMREERAYLDEDVSLARLADDLQIRSQQLSEILNARIGLGFRDYINGFRLEEAARLLIEEPRRSILSILFASGFNSKSSFHKLFQARFHCSPAEYRHRKSKV
jgi:AraC-like DNA-binding protein